MVGEGRLFLIHVVVSFQPLYPIQYTVHNT
jgi:hypothetical protein